MPTTLTEPAGSSGAQAGGTHVSPHKAVLADTDKEVV